MRTHRLNLLHVSRLRPLAACLAIVFSAEVYAATAVHDQATALIHPVAAPRSARSLAGTAFQSAVGKSAIAAPDHPTATFLVTNCNDAGQDSLRGAVIAANALGGDAAIEFDLSTAACSTITLSTGEIDISVNNLTIGGPGPEIVTIDGGYGLGHSNRIFKHTGQGILHLDHLVLTDAIYSMAGNQQALGGCIYSGGTAYLSSTRLDSCRAVAETAAAQGGGVWARAVKLIDSVVTNCGASSQSQASGGGIFADLQGFTIKGSTISNNIAASYAQVPQSAGGGAAIHSNGSIENSTVSGNQAQFEAGFYSTKSIAIANSTITANSAVRRYGAMYVSASANIYNSTITFNTANEYGSVAGVAAASVYAVSSIIASNVNRNGGGSVESDVISNDGHVSGSHNLIIAADATTMLPPDTLDGCPRLGPLSNNGGITRTHALLPGSVAIDAGDDPFSLGTDQRGAGFPRVVGSKADIGAYEWSAGSGDTINRSGFDPCD